MEIPQELVCDGCGQAAQPAHIARRLQRLEWATRYRPVHIGTLLLGAAAPNADAEFFYAPEGPTAGEAALLVKVAGLTSDQPKEQLHAAFQRAGFFATYVLECPFEGAAPEKLTQLLAKRLPAAVARIRRSLRPKRLALISGMLEPFVSELGQQLPGCQIVLQADRAFRLDSGEAAAESLALRKALALETS
jgi:hypothetical protein